MSASSSSSSSVPRRALGQRAAAREADARADDRPTAARPPRRGAVGQAGSAAAAKPNADPTGSSTGSSTADSTAGSTAGSPTGAAPDLPAGDARQGVESVETSARLLQALAGAAHPMMLRDLARAADMPAAKAHRYLVSLVRAGLVSQQAHDARYDIGPFAIQLGLAGLARLDPLQVASAALEDLRDRLGQTVALAVPGSHGPTIVRWLDSRAPVSASLRTGAVMPLTRSATGRVFLAFDPALTAPDGPWARWLADELAQNRQRGLPPADASALPALIDLCRRHGLARVTGELSPGIHSVSAPVFDAQGRLVLAVTALGHGGPFDAGWQGEPARAVRDCATRIGQGLGARPATSDTGVGPTDPAAT